MPSDILCDFSSSITPKQAAYDGCTKSTNQASTTDLRAANNLEEGSVQLCCLVRWSAIQSAPLWNAAASCDPSLPVLCLVVSGLVNQSSFSESETSAEERPLAVISGECVTVDARLRDLFVGAEVILRSRDLFNSPLRKMAIAGY
jgi:hypothetical protein